MAWDLKKTLGNNSSTAAISNAENQSSRRRESSSTRPEQQTDKAAGARCDAGIILHSTRTCAGARRGNLPELLYGHEYDCAFCRGTGQLSNETVCPICRGGGKVSAPAPAVRCAFCKGRGQVPPRSKLTCCVCNGRGIVPVRPPIQLCPDCRGRGKQRGRSLYCNRCRGAGVITSRHCSNDGSGVSSDIKSEPKLERKAS